LCSTKCLEELSRCCRTRLSASYLCKMRDGDPRNSNPCLPLAPIHPVAPTAQRLPLVYRLVYPLVYRLLPLRARPGRRRARGRSRGCLGPRGPDRVESRRETTGYVSYVLLGSLEEPLAFGWCGCWYGTPDGDWKWGRFYRLRVGKGGVEGVRGWVWLGPYNLVREAGVENELG
jgi:hypothetical protein